MSKIPKPSQLPAVVPADVGAIALRDADIDKACVELQLVRFNSKTIKALKVVGAALEAGDIARISATKVILTQEKLQDLLSKLDHLIENNEDDPQTLIEAIRAATAICSENNRASELAVKILEAKLIEKKDDAPRKFKSFSPGEIVQPIQVNVTTTGQVKEVKVDTPGA